MSAQTANEIGGLDVDSFVNKIAHAIAGCAVGAANAGNSGGCAAGAIGAVVGELTAEAIGRREDTVAVASLMAGVAAALAGGDGAQVALAGQAGGNAAANNYLNHDEAAVRERLRDMQRRGLPLTAAEQATLERLEITDIERDLALRDACRVSGPACDTARRGLNAALATYASGATAMQDARLSPTANAGVIAERDQNIALGNDPSIAAQSLLDSFKEFALPQLAGYAVGGALGAYANEAQAIYAGMRAASAEVAVAELAAAQAAREATQAALAQRAAEARALLPSSIRNSGNMGVAEIDVPGVQASMSASSRVKTPDLTQQASGYVGQVTETFPSSVLPTNGNPPFLMNRAIDSEATILNNIALQLGNNTTATGTIHLFTERAPCESCSNVIQQFQMRYPNITINVFDNGGKNVIPTKK